jgi:ferrochelatase
MSGERIGVLVMAYGGPGSLEDVEAYLKDVRGGRAVPPAVIDEVRERYRQIGGCSPILQRTQAQAQALQAALDAQDAAEFQTFVGMRHWHPYIADTLGWMASMGVRRAVGLVMAPHYSRMSIAEYYKRVEQAQTQIGIMPIERWHLLPGYVAALVRLVQDGLARFPAQVREQVPILFTAHSLPQRILDWRDPYPVELQATVDAVMTRLGPRPHGFAYQSAALTHDPWLGPDAGQIIRQLASEGHQYVLLAPIGFVSEHVEILYDIDIEYQRLARECGVHLERIEMLNSAPEMIHDLATLVRGAAAQRGWTCRSDSAS